MEGYRYIQESWPTAESNGLRFLTVRSQALARRVDITVYAPYGVESHRGAPLVLLLHGECGSHWQWAYQLGVHREAYSMIVRQEIRPFVIAMPADGLWGDGGGYIDSQHGEVERWIVEETPALIRERVHGVDDNSRLYIGGISMGGYGALRIGAKHPELFAGIVAHSPLTGLDQLEDLIEDPIEELRPTAEEPVDVLHWMLANRNSLPPIRFDCGLDDPLLPHSRELHAALEEAGVEHIYEELEGGHDCHYWRRNVNRTLRFIARLERQHRRAGSSRVQGAA